MQKIHRWILRLHFYGGLLCVGGLIQFGVSSLAFNHRLELFEPSESKSVWERTLAIEPLPDNGAFSERIRDQLGLMGWPLPWKTEKDASGNLKFDLARPGKDYTIEVFVSEQRVKVEERRKGFWPVLNSLHGLTGVPNSGLATVWGWYVNLCVVVVVFAGFSGIYLWAGRRNERLVGGITLTGAVLVSLAILVWARIGL